MGSSGLEPPTSRLSGVRSNHLSYEPISYLSVYLVLSPICLPCPFGPPLPSPSCNDLWLRWTSLSSARRMPLVEMMGFEPMTPCLQGRCSPNWATPPFFWGFLLLSSLLVTQNWTTSESYSHLYLTWPLVCRDFALLKTTKSRKPCLQISCSP